MSLYARVKFPGPPSNRPYILINMVATIDGKTVSGERDEPVMDLGSAIDHATLRKLERRAGAVLVGAGTVRATPKMWYPQGVRVFIVSRSLDLPWTARVFQDGSVAGIITPARDGVPPGLKTIPVSAEDSLAQPLRELRTEYGVSTLLCEGGSELNSALLREDLVDEIFLTVAPKIKLGRTVPTLAGGEPLPRSALLKFGLMSCRPVEDEVFLRYRRRP
jgi:riboflavin biosynthesis pyrimidine reductase